MPLDDVRALLLKRASRFASARRGSTGVAAWTRHHGVSKSHVSEFLMGKRLPTTDVLEALNLEWRICRKRAPRPTPESGESV